MEKQNYQTEEDLMKSLDILEEYYDKDSCKYKFNYTFHNLIDSTKKVPVVLKGHIELETRISVQKSFVHKINEGIVILGSRINELALRSDMTHKKIINAVEVARKMYKYDGNLDKIYSLKRELLFEVRDKLIITGKDNKNALISLNNRLLDLKNMIKEYKTKKEVSSC